MKKIYDFSMSSISEFWSGNVPDDGLGYFNNCTILKHDFFPDKVLNKFELHIDLTSEEFGDVIIKAFPYVVWLNGDVQTCICRNCVGNTMVQSFDLHLQKSIVNKFKITFSGNCIEVNLNDKLLKFESDYKSFITSIEITLPGKSKISTFELFGAVREKKLQSGINVNVDTTIDFLDDIMLEPFNEEMLNLTFQKISELGIRRVYWIHYGSQESGIWLSQGVDIICKNVAQTIKSLGGDLLPKVTELAHKHGLELFALLKPFDMSVMGYTFPVSSVMAKKYGKNEIVGGKAYFCFDYVADHTDLCMQRRQKQNVKCQISPLRIEINFNGTDIPEFDIHLWTSEYNDTYSIYDQAMAISRMPGKLIIAGINTKYRYIAIELMGKSEFLCGNILRELVRVYDDSGELIECTLGLKPRDVCTYDEKSYHLKLTKNRSSFHEVGFDFDGLRLCVPSGVLCGDAAPNHYKQFDLQNNFLGIAIGCNRYVPGAMCPAEPEAVSYWLKLVQEAIDCGVDGIDIRASGHLDILKWGEYGFNAPIVKEYQKRYSVNIIEQDFDKALLRKLRGEFYTEFLRLAAHVVWRRGKKVQIHIEDVMEGSADGSTMMEIYWDWQKWIEDIRPDGVTFKAINPDSFSGSYAIKIVEKCNEYKIPVDCCVFTHCVEDYKKCFESLMEVGFSAVNLYEFASYYKAQRGKIMPIDEKLIAEVKAYITSNEKLC